MARYRARDRKGIIMASQKRVSSQGEEGHDLFVLADKAAASAAKAARPRRKVCQNAIRRLFLDAAPQQRQSGKGAAKRESRTAIVVARPARAGTAPLAQTFSTPFNRQ